jgi:glucosamine--fructose-6-phosphate aminotransferase (isomerizing)
VTRDGICIYADDKIVERKLQILEMNNDMVDRGEYRHYMSKEIAEQPQAITSCLEGRISKTQVLDSAFGLSAKTIFSQVKRVQLVACGTSFHAALVARYWLEALAGIPCTVEVASELLYLFVCHNRGKQQIH